MLFESSWVGVQPSERGWAEGWLLELRRSSLHDFTICTTLVVVRVKESRPVGWYRSGQDSRGCAADRANAQWIDSLEAGKGKEDKGWKQNTRPPDPVFL